jgi:hypothetical protein
MMLIIVGAGASYDSVPARPIEVNSGFRPPLANQLFDARDYFLAEQRLLSPVLQVAAQLGSRQKDQSVEDVLEIFSAQQKDYPQRLIQLAATRYYLQAIITISDSQWVGNAPVSTNMHTLVDRIEAVRRGRERPIFVTFNYDRMIERALESWDQRFRSLDGYIDASGTRLFKLHGSADWCRTVGALPLAMDGGNPMSVINEVCRSISRAELGPIEMGEFSAPMWRRNSQPIIPALAVPLKTKTTFECPEKHLEALRAALPRVEAILTIGWRGGEHHFLDLVGQHVAKRVEVICVGGDNSDADQTVANLQTVVHGEFAASGQGFTRFLQTPQLERLLNCTWAE